MKNRDEAILMTIIFFVLVIIFELLNYFYHIFDMFKSNVL